MTEMEQFGAQLLSVKKIENKPDIDFICSYGFQTCSMQKHVIVRHNGHKSSNFGVD